MYAVIAGTKTFILKPPSSIHQMHLSTYDVWQEHMHSEDLSFTVQPAHNMPRVRWCPIDPNARVTLEGNLVRCGDDDPEACALAGAHQHVLRAQVAQAPHTRHRHQEPQALASHAQSACELRARRLFPRFFSRPEALTVMVHAGDILYLPAMWYHHVEQDEGLGEAVIAVNFWFDMCFDARYAHFTLLEHLSECAGLLSPM
jgi:hypothetical protein